MKKILVPTDFSKCAGSAMKYAMDMAVETGAEIISLHLVSPYEGVDVDGSGLLWIKEYQEAKAKALVSWVKKYHRMPAYKNVKITPVCNIGFTVTEIAERAKEENVDLIIMGTTGASGVNGMLFGSIAGGVIAVAKTPVMLIPQNAKFSKTLPFGMASDFKIDCGKESILLLREVLSLHGQSSMKVVHVLTESDSKPNDKQEKEIVAKLKGIDISFHYLHDKHVANAIDNFIEASGVKFLCAISHKHSYIYKIFHGSIAKKLAFHVQTPLLVLFD